MSGATSTRFQGRVSSSRKVNMEDNVKARRITRITLETEETFAFRLSGHLSHQVLSMRIRFGGGHSI